MSVPIAVSLGRGGFAPQLALSYDSGAGNGPFGLGWGLSVPSITRKTDKGLPRYQDDSDGDTYLLAGAEDLVRLADADGRVVEDETWVVYGRTFAVRCYRPRIESLFARIERWSERGQPSQVFWRTLTRDNVTSWFGRTDSSRVQDPDEPARIFQWHLCESHDDKGNVAVYQYQREDGAGVDRTLLYECNRHSQTALANTYLKRIFYGNCLPFLPTLAAATPSGLAWQEPGMGAGDWLFEVVFDYGEHAAGTPQPAPIVQSHWPVRRDPFSSHRAGFEVRTWRLCRRVLMLHHFPNDPQLGLDCLVRSTDFEYSEPRSLEDASTAGYTVLQAVTQRSYQRRTAGDSTYESRALPPLTFRYSRATVDSSIRAVDAQQLANLPVGMQGPGYQWVDLDGEGLSGVLTEQGGAWHYKPNRGDGRFGPTRLVARLPATATLAAGRQQLMDLAGDGEIDLVDFDGPTPGFHERSRDEGWKRHVPFASLPQVDWQDPKLRFVDLTGDGHADALITEDEVFTWYPSLDERGFAPAQRNRQAIDEDAGPRLVFNDGTQTLFLADMCGDGLTDLVRIRNGQVCYWPNLGYGRFGRKLTLAHAPRFDSPDQFDPQRIRLADIDGSGPVDILYLASDGAQLYFNRSGNSLSDAKHVALPAATHNLAAVQVADLLGNGTACLVWNSHLPADAAHPVRYIDLMSGTKPHLLIGVDNHLGATTEIEYTPSTRFYLQDLATGTPWVTRLPFPVHCVSRVTVRDHWRDTEFTSTSSYHHGYFDGAEREFRGFGRVEQVDIECFGDPGADQAPVKTITWYHTGAANDRQRILGSFAQEYFPQRYAARLPGAAQPQAFQERPLPEPELPPGLTADEWREAHRACKGMVLRQEVYELDSRGRQPVRLFSAATHNCRIARLQPRGKQRHAVFHVTESEALTYHYELALPNDASALQPDPRVAHSLNLRHDEYGNPQQSVSIGYGRWQSASYPWLPRPALANEVQGETHIAYTELRYTTDVQHDVSGQAWRAASGVALRHRRLRVPCETLTHELKAIPKRGTRYYTPQDFTPLDLSAHYGHRAGELAPAVRVVAKAYHDASVGNVPQQRLVEHTRTRYFDDASESAPPANPLSFGQHGPRGLTYESYKLALTDALLNAVFGIPDAADPLTDKLGWEVVPALAATAATPARPAQTARALLQDPLRSGYIRGTDIGGTSGEYWVRSGVAGFNAQAARAFYLPDRYTDAFGNPTRLRYGPDFLYLLEAQDALGNTTGVQRFDHRVLAPARLRDASQNCTEVAFDILGLPVAAAVLGKVTPGANAGRETTETGDSVLPLSFADLNPSPSSVAAFCNAKTFDEVQARQWLGTATTRFVYHHGETRDAQGQPTWLQRMAGACAISRETHVAKLSTGQQPRLQVALECSDGHGAVMMSKAQAEPEATGGAPRWVVNGLTVLNNKGKPVKQYEPAFSPHFGCETPADNGVSPTLFYDAPGRLVRTELPDGTLTRAVFTPWHSEAWDANDAVLESTWLQDKGRNSLPLAEGLRRRANGLVNAQPDARAGWLVRHYAGTPARTLLDSLGREVVAVAHNRVPSPTGPLRMGGRNWRDQFIVTFTRLDAEGKPLWMRDGRGNLVMQYIAPPKPTRWADQRNEHVPRGSAPAYDIAGNLLYQHSMDAGDRWMLMDAAGKPMLAWDFNQRQDDAPTSAQPGPWWQEWRLYATEYDALHRPTAQWLRVWRSPVPPAGTPAPRPAAVQAQARVMLERFEYQDGQAADAANLNGQLVRHFDTSGQVRTVRRSFAGNVEEVHRQLVADAKIPWVDWQTPPAANDSRLEADTYRQITEHDALGRMMRLYNWHREVSIDALGAEQATPGRTNRVAVYEPQYNARGLLRAEALHVHAGKTTAAGRPVPDTQGARTQQAIEHIAYNAKGQKTELRLGNGTTTRYRYDNKSFRLTQILTLRAQGGAVQNLQYVYDAVGNITHIRDDAQQTVYFKNARVEPSNDYRYDALNRLVEASGREQAGITGLPRTPEGPWPQAAIPTDASLRRYTQRYVYDEVGNFITFQHVAAGGSWTRHYATATDSNRLLRTWEGDADWTAGTATQKAEYRYDPHGSMLNLGATPIEFDLHWNHRDMIRHIHLGGGGNAWYQYDSGKQRTRKFIARQGGGIEERLYLGGFERYRRRNADGDVVEEIESHHLFEGEQRVLLVDDVLLAREQPGPSGISLEARTCWRYQYGNRLGSVGVELDEAARVISYEEFHPYGTSAYRVLNEDEAARAPAKRYRYTGMERDEESGLSYHLARHYGSWLGRWTGCDPAGISAGMNLFMYVSGAAVGKNDVNGREEKPTTHLTLSPDSRPYSSYIAPFWEKEHWADRGTVSRPLIEELQSSGLPKKTIDRYIKEVYRRADTSPLNRDVASLKTRIFDSLRRSESAQPGYSNQAEYLQMMRDSQTVMKLAGGSKADVQAIPGLTNKSYAVWIKAESIAKEYIAQGKELPTGPELRKLLKTPSGSPEVSSSTFSRQPTLVKNFQKRIPPANTPTGTPKSQTPLKNQALKPPVFGGAAAPQVQAPVAGNISGSLKNAFQGTSFSVGILGYAVMVRNLISVASDDSGLVDFGSGIPMVTDASKLPWGTSLQNYESGMSYTWTGASWAPDPI